MHPRNQSQSWLRNLTASHVYHEKGKLGSSLTKVQAFTLSQPLRWAFG
ncbi:hypothetical protein BMETH_1617_0 [methanotrophic bacterial endosymbiont of Bathymodiolus sp.]|nr:hypothetical protein BMETH_1617_0 [methanotrophic bacterial endosymbiont of Bathymodiolus sp.]